MEQKASGFRCVLGQACYDDVGFLPGVRWVALIVSCRRILMIKGSESKREAWETPRLSRIEAGSAEARQTTGKNDIGGTGQITKS